MLFTIGRKLVSFLLSTYFNPIAIQGAQPHEEGPVIIAVNHPNMALDPLLMLTVYQRPLFFLGKSTLFKNPVIAKLLRSCHLIPVYRPADRKPHESNDATFEEVRHLLERREGITIFPEGTSILGRTVLKLKTGAARMAFFAEEKNGWSLGVTIQPVGITYAHFIGWNSGVAITIGEPIPVASLRSVYEQDSGAAIRQLTNTIESALKNLTIHVEQSDLAPLIDAIHQLFTRSGRISPVDTEAFSKIAEKVTALAPLYPEKAADILRRARLLLALPQTGTLPNWFLAALPLVVTGVALHTVPYTIARRAAHAVSPHEDELGMYAFFLGSATFIGWYLLIALLLLCNGSLLTAPFILTSLAALGLLAARTLPLWRLFLLSLVLPSSARALSLLHDELIDELIAYGQEVADKDVDSE